MNPELVQSIAESHEKQRRKRSLIKNEIVIEDVPQLRPSTSSESLDISRDPSLRSPSVCCTDISSVTTPSSMLNRIVENEMQCNRRKRIVYTKVPIEGIFSETCKIPFCKEDLTKFDLKSHTSYCRQDASIVMDYVKQLPGIDAMITEDKEHTFRLACYVDGLMSSAWYSWQLGFTDQLVVLWNGTYISMDPVPPTGREPEAMRNFASQEEHFQYTSIIPFEIQKWQELVFPLRYLNLTFEEMALLKALTIYQICYFKYTEEARKESMRQRDMLISALFELCKSNGMNHEDAVERVGELILATAIFIVG
ncbi:hypothetical protein WR25_26866 [Diploscapter pachys]|uniref:NR LBD domain-containing protein n=1 Tax=Diploscapter pachys TaxID=2018661 RepID=A0A2A2L6Z1_9BILA|nr:hypothetical protein WR25_26866 [Diploscapter pachys]